MQTDEITPTQEVQEMVPQAVPFSAISTVKHIQAENVYIKTTHVPHNVKFYTKRTPDEHVAILAFGEILTVDGDKQTRLKAPASYTIPANTRIACFTITDCVFYCVHATTETDLGKLDQIY